MLRGVAEGEQHVRGVLVLVHVGRAAARLLHRRQPLCGRGLGAHGQPLRRLQAGGGGGVGGQGGRRAGRGVVLCGGGGKVWGLQRALV